MRATKILILIAFLSVGVAFGPVAVAAPPLPRVFVDSGVGGSTLVKTQVRPHGHSYNSCPAPLIYLSDACWKNVPDPFDEVYKLRPLSISVSADGSDDLSNIDWVSWGQLKALGSGLQFVRCWPPESWLKKHPGSGGWPLPPGVPYGRCPGGSGVQDSFSEPVAIHLSMPVETAHGPVFTLLATSWKDFSMVLPPAAS